MVSIITPTYNHDKYIEECIISVIQQSYTDWELIIIDDASTDDTENKIKKFLSNNKIHYLRTDHYGPENLDKIYNLGLERSKGEYIAILEGDDKWPKNKLEIQVGRMNANPDYSISYGDCVNFTDSGKKYRINSLIDEECNFNNPIGSSLILFSKNRNFIPAVTSMIRKDFLVQMGGFVKGHDMNQVDFSTWVTASLSTKFLYIKTILGYWRRHEASLTSTKIKELHESKIKFVNTFVKNSRGKIDSKVYKKITKHSNMSDHKYLLSDAKNSLLFDNYETSKHQFYNLLFKHKVVSPVVLIGLISSLIKVDLLYLYYKYIKL